MIYRFALSLTLLTMFLTGMTADVLGSLDPMLFKWTCILYTLFCLGSLFVFKAEQLIHSVNRVTFLLIVDIFALILMTHASGGTESGMAYLLIVMAAICSIFATGIVALGLAAFITIFILGETIYLTQNTGSFTHSIFSAGTLSILVFATTLAFQYLTLKIRKTTAEAARHSKDAENLQRIGQDIIKRMQTGVIVIDEKDNLALINSSAKRMLDIASNKDYYGTHIDVFSNLKNVIDDWRTSPVVGIPTIHLLRAGQEVKINFATLDGRNNEAQTILYMEDNRALTQQAQQLKLASLGRLTASIAHEIRNPLGAIAHASQLLKESPDLPKGDQRLTEIILQHSDRVNHLIENTLNLSRRKEASPETLFLSTWVPAFAEEYSRSNQGDINIHHREGDDPLKIRMDPLHLRQVITNLFDNGLRYSLENTAKASVDVVIGYSENIDKNYIEIVDYGKGVPEEQVDQIFEPFFTTAEKGSGLGLFISKELCEINRANLHYKRTEQQQSCFRIEFSHHQRII